MSPSHQMKLGEGEHRQGIYLGVHQAILKSLQYTLLGWREHNSYSTSCQPGRIHPESGGKSRNSRDMLSVYGLALACAYGQ